MRAIRGAWSGDDRRMRGESQAGQNAIRKNAEIVTERDIRAQRGARGREPWGAALPSKTRVCAGPGPDLHWPAANNAAVFSGDIPGTSLKNPASIYLPILPSLALVSRRGRDGR